MIEGTSSNFGIQDLCCDLFYVFDVIMIISRSLISRPASLRMFVTLLTVYVVKTR